MNTTIVTEGKPEIQANEASLAFCPLGVMYARNDINGIAMVLSSQWEHMSPTQALQMIERALEDCRPFVPAELHSRIESIVDSTSRIRVKRAKRRGGAPCR